MATSMRSATICRSSAPHKASRPARHAPPRCQSLPRCRRVAAVVAADEKQETSYAATAPDTVRRLAAASLSGVLAAQLALAGPSVAAMLPGEASGGAGLGGGKGLVELARQEVPEAINRATGTSLGSAARDVKSTINAAENVAPDLQGAKDIADKAKRQAAFSADRAKGALEEAMRNVQPSSLSTLPNGTGKVLKQAAKTAPETPTSADNVKRAAVGDALDRAGAIVKKAEGRAGGKGPALSNVAAAPTSTDNAAEQAAAAGREQVQQGLTKVRREERGKPGASISGAGARSESAAGKATRDLKRGRLGIPNLPDVAAAPTTTDDAAEQAAAAGREAVQKGLTKVRREERGKPGASISAAGARSEEAAGKATKDPKRGTLGLPNLPQS